MNTYFMKAGDYALDKTSGLCYRIVTDTVQTLGRRQCEGMKLRKESRNAINAHSKNYGGSYVRICESNLIPITPFEATICSAAEQLIRNKMFRGTTGSLLVKQHKALLENCGINPTIVEKRYSGNR